MILVTGATGHLGGHVVSHLKQQLALNQFAVLARNIDKAKGYVEQGVEVRLGDFNEPQSLAKAFAGVSKLLLISTMDMNRLEQHKNVVDAAKQAGVQHIIYTGLAIQNIDTSAVKDLMISHFQTEDYIRESGLNYTFLRNTMYAEAIPQIIGEDAVETGIVLSGGEGKVPYVTRAELGEATAKLLLQSGHENQTYHLVGSQAYSYQDIADVLGQLNQTTVAYQNLTVQNYREFLGQIGLPEFLVYLTHGTVLDIANHQYEVASTDLEKLLGRKSASLQEYLKTIYA